MIKRESLAKCSRLAATIALTLVATLAVADSPQGELRIETVESPAADSTGDPTSWNIYQGDQLLAGYLADSGGKPIVYPIRGPGGHAMTRDFPMRKDVRMEASDHDHQRSLWFTHGDVNGVDFWKDDEGCGKIVQRDGKAEVDTKSGHAVLTTQNDWIGTDGKRLLSDTRHFEFFIDGKRRVIDCDILLKATDGDVNFGDTKEGSFGMRIAASMKVDVKKGGEITNAEGETNKAAWGKPSPWVNYSGPVDNETVGITIHNHPSSFGFPTRWHVRTYGLFAANPFGRFHFVGGKKQDGIVLLEGKQMRLNYRVVLSQAKFDADVTGADAKSYHNDPRPVVE